MYTVFLVVLLFSCKLCELKYLEGEINTREDWIFLARFCFHPEDGKFEYYFEFSEDQGAPNLLLYYDTNDQWPAVYKTNKNCYEKEAVLPIEQNQILNLTITNQYFKDLSGCAIKPTTTPSAHDDTNTSYVTISSVSNTSEEYFGFAYKNEGLTNQSENTFDAGNWSTLNKEPIKNHHVNEWVEVSTAANDSGLKAPIRKQTVPITKRAVPPSTWQKRESRVIYCNNARKFRSSRERWWFIALSNCNGTRGIHVKYKILMTNGPSGDYWHEHFSADEFYILPVLIAFSIAYSFLMLGIIICSIRLKSNQLLNATHKIFAVSAIFQFLGTILTSAAYWKYAINGIEQSEIKTVGAMFMGASETLYLLLLLLLAKGFTIVRNDFPLAVIFQLTVLMGLYVVAYICILIYESSFFDPGEVLYLYESPVGYGLIILKVLDWCTFIYFTVLTLKHYPEKSKFYHPFIVGGTIWFMAGPGFILLANTFIDKLILESTVCAVLQFVTLGGYLTFLVYNLSMVYSTKKYEVSKGTTVLN